MKKNFLCLLSLILSGACGQPGQWSSAEQKKVKDAIAAQRERFSLQYVENKDFSALQECAVRTLSDIFPEFAAYDSLPDRDATLNGMMADCIADLTGSDYEHLDKLFPYTRLVEAGLVSGQIEKGAFCDCFTGKLRGTYFNSDVFIMSLLVDPTAPDNLYEILRQCGKGE